ncbi:hypothetical protein [Actinomadura verrucosospora]|uniref:Autotransporter-associated beta strand repeat-containing protein n=1 Tax=Actinomadura verrucosospora TaxID=46165 RepID=A0A7D3VTV9_ACTVE|nr:hypothetical protein [Actinomadura verrucosospora]QKG22920.1 autotransporter-associated beta strand repeat-containing protein [Actinomadura verrucosospora]
MVTAPNVIVAGHAALARKLRATGRFPAVFDVHSATALRELSQSGKVGSPATFMFGPDFAEDLPDAGVPVLANGLAASGFTVLVHSVFSERGDVFDPRVIADMGPLTMGELLALLTRPEARPAPRREPPAEPPPPPRRELLLEPPPEAWTTPAPAPAQPVATVIEPQAAPAEEPPPRPVAEPEGPPEVDYQDATAQPSPVPEPAEVTDWDDDSVDIEDDLPAAPYPTREQRTVESPERNGPPEGGDDHQYAAAYPTEAPGPAEAMGPTEVPSPAEAMGFAEAENLAGQQGAGEWTWAETAPEPEHYSYTAPEPDHHGYTAPEPDQVVYTPLGPGPQAGPPPEAGAYGGPPQGPHQQSLVPVPKPPRSGSRRGKIVLMAGAVLVLVAGLTAAAVLTAGAGNPDRHPAAAATPAGSSPASASPPAAPAPSSSPTAVRPAEQYKPANVRIVDSRVSIEVSWKDATGGKASYYVVGGPQGQRPSTLANTQPGATKVVVAALNPSVEYCLTVVAVVDVDRVAYAKPVCTHRGK